MQSTLYIRCGLVKADATVMSKPRRPTGLLVYVHTRPEELNTELLTTDDVRNQTCMTVNRNRMYRAWRCVYLHILFLSFTSEVK